MDESYFDEIRLSRGHYKFNNFRSRIDINTILVTSDDLNSDKYEVIITKIIDTDNYEFSKRQTNKLTQMN